MAEKLNLAQITNLINIVNTENKKTVYVPSLKTDVPVLGMNASHLKDVIKATMEGVFRANVFSRLVYSVFKDIGGDDSPILKMTTLDKIAVLLQLRNQNVKSSVSVDVTYDNKTVPTVFDLKPILKRIKSNTLTFDDVVIKSDDFAVTIGFPTVDHEAAFDMRFSAQYLNSVDQTDKAALKELFGPLFIHELAQFVKVVQVKENAIDMLTLPVDTRLGVVEKLPGILITRIIEQIDSVFGTQIRFLTAVETEIDGNRYTGNITMDPSIFT